MKKLLIAAVVIVIVIAGAVGTMVASDLSQLRTDVADIKLTTAMTGEGWFTAQEAVDAGLAHKVVERPAAAGGAEPAVAARWDRSVSQNRLAALVTANSPTKGRLRAEGRPPDRSGRSAPGTW